MTKSILMTRPSKFELNRAIYEKELKGFEQVGKIYREVHDHWDGDFAITYKVKMQKKEAVDV
ncbi:hypothetical protein [Geomicrobium sp. JCM 19038]|uniref:hypothetical protein n=1 Tax=Geomicrobium sp. JCM 19038 TaxID=1460635 RepID=UPI00045F3E03|nr:hypothetical protein [Geomicrobium sp. JCM 19038]GAK08974.1 hypothetical protein JCM19038_2779 [Geomicrobium sp. JCM 19038]